MPSGIYIRTRLHGMRIAHALSSRWMEPEFAARQIKLHTGRKFSSEAKKRLSTERMGRVHSPETRLKISQTQKGRPVPLRRRKLLSAASKRLWSQPSYRARACKAMKGKHAGSKHPMWQGGKSFEEYSYEFKTVLNKMIKTRDGGNCRNPFCKHSKCRTMHVHHIDYDKKNDTRSNLITLCLFCHMKSNHSRDKQRQYYTRVMNAYIFPALDL